MNWYMQNADCGGIELVDARGRAVVDKDVVFGSISRFAPHCKEGFPIGVESRGGHVFGYVKTETKDQYGRFGYAVFHALRSELMQPEAEKFFLVGLSGLHASFAESNAQMLRQKVFDELNGENRAQRVNRIWMVVAAVIVALVIIGLIVK